MCIENSLNKKKPQDAQSFCFCLPVNFKDNCFDNIDLGGTTMLKLFLKDNKVSSCSRQVC